MTLDLDELDAMLQEESETPGFNPEWDHRMSWTTAKELIAAARESELRKAVIAELNDCIDKSEADYKQAIIERDLLKENIDSIRMNIETEMLHGHDSSLAKYIMSITDGDA